MLGRLLALFIGVPLIELLLFYEIGSRIGPLTTILIVVATGFLGAWLTKKQGLRTLERYRTAAGEGRIPHNEVMDGLMILVAGAVLLTPGFLTDAIGFALLLPPVRTAVRTRLGKFLSERVTVVTQRAGEGMGDAPPSGSPSRERVVDARVIDE